MSENIRRMTEALEHLRKVDEVLEQARAAAVDQKPVTPEGLATAIAANQAAQILAQRVVQAETQVGILQKFTDAILSAAVHAIIIVDANETIVAWNDSAARIYGWLPSEAIGKRLSELIIPERYRAEHRRGFAAVAATQQSTSGVLRNVIRVPALTRAGTEIVAELLIVPLEFDGLFHCISFSRDTAVPLHEASPHIDTLMERS